MSSVPLRTLVRWSPAWLLLVGLVLVPPPAHAQVEIEPVARDFSELHPGESGTLTIPIENTGTASVDAFLTLDVPSELQLDAVTPSDGSCTQDEGPFGIDVECTFDGVASEATREVAVTVTATDSLGSHIIDLASGRQGQAEPDDEGLTIVEVFSPGEADLAVDCTTEANTVAVGEEVTYSCTVTNTTTTSGGTAGKRVLAPAHNVHVTALLLGLAGEIVEIVSDDTGVECASSYEESGGCNKEQLAEGELFSFNAIVEWSEPGTGTFRVIGDADTKDPNEENDDEELQSVVQSPQSPRLSTSNNPSDGTDGDPVSTFTGELFFTEAPDLSLGGPLPVRFQRYYGSFLERDGRVESALGPGWAHTFDWQVIEVGAGAVEAVSWRGRVIRFEEDGGTWTQATMPERPYQLVEDGEGYRLANPRAQRIYTFDADGTLTAIEDGRSNQLTLIYDGSGRLAEVSDGLGRTLTFTYSGDRLASVSDGSRTVQFGYTDGLLTSATDPLGNMATYSYDDGHEVTGLLTEKTRPGGNTVLTQTYDADGRVASQTDALGNTTTFAYSVDEETGEQTTTVTDAMGNTSEHVHNADGQLLSATDASGQTIDLGYSDGGQRDRITDRLGDDTEYAFDPDSRLPTSVTDARGGVTSFNYTTRSDEGFDFQELVGTGRPDGTSVSYSYDADGNLTSTTGPAGNARTLTYNGRGQPLTITNPEGGTTTLTYNGDGTLASAEDPAGNTTTYSYDGLRRPTSITRPDGPTRTFGYDDADRLTSMTDEEGRTYNFSYDANGNLTQVTDPSGSTAQFSYDAMDRRTGVTDRQGQTLTYSYDALGRLQSKTDRAGNTTTLGYDAEDRLTSITNGAGETWTISYDAEGVPTALTNPAGETTSLTSNSMGWITQITSPLGNSVSRSYDAMGRVTSVQDPSGGTTQLARDARGLLDGMTLPGGASASYARDGLGLLEGRTGPTGGSWDTPRDAQGRQTRQTDPLGQSADNTHDSRNRIVSVGQPGGLGTVTRSYDGTSRLTGLAHSGSPNLNYNYDTNGRLTGATGVSLSRDAEGRITESNGLGITRDSEGRIASVTLPGGTVQYRYDGAGRMTEVEDWQGGITAFSYDNAGRLAQITRPNGTTTAYAYDADGRLTAIDETDADDETLAAHALTRDARGHVTEAERTGPVAPELAPQTENFAYDAAGQVEAFDYDALGRLTDDGTRTYTWDGLSRLASVSNGTETTDFTYDAFGNRLSKSESGTEHTFVWNYALDLPSVAVEQENGTDQRYYVHAPGGRLLYSVDATDGSRRYYHFDEMGNTTLLTGEDGTVQAAYAYSPYGKVVGENGDLDTPFTWQGQFGVMAEGGGLYYVRARYYDAQTRRFLSRDPVRSLRPDEITPYQYARANPRRFVDPTGLLGEFFIGLMKQAITDDDDGATQLKQSAWLNSGLYPTKGDKRFGPFRGDVPSTTEPVQGNLVYNPTFAEVEEVPDDGSGLPPEDVTDWLENDADLGDDNEATAQAGGNGETTGDQGGETDQEEVQGGCTLATFFGTPQLPDENRDELKELLGGDSTIGFRELPALGFPFAKFVEGLRRLNKLLSTESGVSSLAPPSGREAPGDKPPAIMTDMPQDLVIC